MTPAERAVRSYLDCVNGGNAAGLAALFAPDGCLRPPMGGEVRGRSAIERAYSRTFATMKVRAEATGFVNEGHQCVVTLLTTVNGVAHEFIDVFTVDGDAFITDMVAYRRGADS